MAPDVGPDARTSSRLITGRRGGACIAALWVILTLLAPKAAAEEQPALAPVPASVPAPPAPTCDHGQCLPTQEKRQSMNAEKDRRRRLSGGRREANNLRDRVVLPIVIGVPLVTIFVLWKRRQHMRAAWHRNEHIHPAWERCFACCSEAFPLRTWMMDACCGSAPPTEQGGVEMAQPPAAAGPAVAVPVTTSKWLNSPGHWDFFISHTQGNGDATTLASELYYSLKEKGYSAWLDVKMSKKSVAAMEEGVRGAKCVIAIITEGPEPEPGKPSNDYFKRPYCLKELRWARESGVMIQPVVRVQDKNNIGEFLKGAPADLKDLGHIEFIDLHRGDASYFDVGVNKIVQELENLPAAASIDVSMAEA